jgi:alpha-ketoglutarate-dependent taurine dioxygenase
MAEIKKLKLFEGPRGAPSNIGTNMYAVHPAVRTNPVTGWKTVFGGGVHLEKYNDVSVQESQYLIDKIHHMLAENPDLQVRFRWQNVNDMGA